MLFSDEITVYKEDHGFPVQLDKIYCLRIIKYFLVRILIMLGIIVIKP